MHHWQPINRHLTPARAVDLIQCCKNTEVASRAPSLLPPENIDDDDFSDDHEDGHHGSGPEEEPQYDDYDVDSREGCFTFC